MTSKTGKIININNDNLPPSLAKFSRAPGDRKQGINKCWPNINYLTKQIIIDLHNIIPSHKPYSMRIAGPF